MSRPVTLCRSLTTDDSLTAADSSSFSTRCFSRVRSPVRSRRYRVCSRITRNSGVATKHPVTAPRSKHTASHRESDGSRFGRSGRFFTCRASASTHSSPSASSRLPVTTTPRRDAIRLLVDLLFAEKDADLTDPGIVRTLYDPTAGTGGMLALAEEHLLAQNPDAKLSLYGQEYNPQSYAICKSDLLAKGHEATNIVFGNTLTNDAFKSRQFDFGMSNPPYGVDWKQYAKAVINERDSAGPYGRFAPGLPATSDGQMLFLLHLAHKMRAPEDGGGRVGIVMNGSPLFNGAAESGPSNIRKWLLENDLVEAIVALPTSMFFNTGIATYIWILDNTKHPDRRGLVQLIDGTSFWTKMRKNLGSKNRELSGQDREKVVRLYADFLDADVDYSKVLRSDEFGYWTITVERPLLNDDGQPVVDRKGMPKPDPKKRDTENVPFTYGGSAAGVAGLPVRRHRGHRRQSAGAQHHGRLLLHRRACGQRDHRGARRRVPRGRDRH